MKFLTSLFPLDEITIPAPKAPPGLDVHVYEILGYVRWGCACFFVALLLLQASKISAAKRGMESEPIKGFAYWVAGAIIFGSAAQIARMFIG